MQQNNEITKFTVEVDPYQNVLATSKVLIAARIRPFGTARDIDVTLGFDANI